MGFKTELPIELIKQFETLEKNTNKMIGEMTKAGAEVVKKNAIANSPLPETEKYAKLTKTYNTPSDDGINTKVYFKGYLPFSNKNRKYFARRGGSGKMYYTDKGVPVDFLLNLYEYGRHVSPFPKKPFFRKSFKKDIVEPAMLEVQNKYIPKE